MAVTGLAIGAVTGPASGLPDQPAARAAAPSAGERCAGLIPGYVKDLAGAMAGPDVNGYDAELSALRRAITVAGFADADAELAAVRSMAGEYARTAAASGPDAAGTGLSAAVTAWCPAA
ncbi:MAG TPA: hypothetical protein VHL53_08210 [Acidimicrobiia bacterium]|nr:hypothetical protein [Acidimicrobiia bacterium]